MKTANSASMAAIVVTVLACLAGTVRADWSQQFLSPGVLNPCYIPLGSKVAITVDEYGDGKAVWFTPDGHCVQLPWAMLQDTGPGGLSNKLTYSLMDPESANGHLTAGDVCFYDSNWKLQDIMRFNYTPFNPKPYNPGPPGTIVLYSNNQDDIVSLADSAPPQKSYKNVAFIFNGVMTYHPGGPVYAGGRPYLAAWPGYVPGYDVTYYFSDVAIVVPVPGAAVLAALGLGLVGWRKRRLGRTPPGY